MGTLALPNTITPGTNEDATQVQENDEAIRDFVNSGTGIGTNNIAVLPACRINRTTNQSIPDATSTVVGFDSERYDTDSMHSNVLNSGRITFTTAGVYVVTGHVFFDGGSGRRALFIRLNGTTTLANEGRNAVTGDGTAVSIATTYSFAAGDYVELMAIQSSGGALNILTLANQSPEMSAAFLTRAS